MYNDIYSAHEQVDSNSLEHYGRKGMKWYQHIFGDNEKKPTYRIKRNGSSYDETGHRKLTTNKFIESSKNFAIELGYEIANKSSLEMLIYNMASALLKPALRKHINFKKKEGQVEDIKAFKKMKVKEDVNQSLKKANISHRKLHLGSDVNCASCSIAMDMRQKGYDVRARRQNHGLTTSEIASMYKNGTFKQIPAPDGYPKKNRSPQKSFNNVCDTLANVNGGNSSGILTMTWPGFLGGGHAIYYTCKDKKVEFYDGQVGKYGSKIDSYFVNGLPNGFEYIRTDNKKPADRIGECVVSYDRSTKK